MGKEVAAATLGARKEQAAGVWETSLAPGWPQLRSGLPFGLMLGKIDGGRRRGRQRMRWLDGTKNKV